MPSASPSYSIIDPVNLPENALSLLPARDDTMRCADHSRAIGTSPAGTAIAADAVVVIETPRPWPKPVFAHPLLDGLASVMQLHCGTTRILAAEASRSDITTVTTFERGEVGATAHTFDVEGREQLHDLMDRLRQSYPAEILDRPSATPPPELAALICTQGSHDVCCGSDGVRLASALAEAAPGLALYRVSHTGGHRFAPTAMTLPDGRMWADLDVERTLSILDLTGDAAALAARCRGWWGAAAGPAQAAEIAVFRELGWSLDDQPRTVATTADPDAAGRWLVTVDVARQVWTVEVALGRVVPTISCRAEGGLPAKPGQEYEIVSLTPPARSHA